MKQSLLVELNTEELPPKALKSLSEAFASGLAKGLRDRQFLSDDSVVTAFGAPRRLAVHITHVLYRSPDKPFRQKLMPLAVARDAASNWTHAFVKKLESLGRRHMASVPVGTQDGPDCLVVESDGKADSVFLQAVQPGQSLRGRPAVRARGSARGAADPEGHELPARRRHDDRAVRSSGAPAGRDARARGASGDGARADRRHHDARPPVHGAGRPPRALGRHVRRAARGGGADRRLVRAAPRAHRRTREGRRGDASTRRRSCRTSCWTK